MRKLLVLAIALYATLASAAPSAKEILKLSMKLMGETAVIARTDFEGSIAEFKADGDPKTLELVFLKKPEPGANSVSEDGEVIYFFEASDQVQSDLTNKAFDVRAERRLSGK